MREPPSRDSNPFATCWTAPGALPFVATPTVSPAAVFERLERAGWRGQLVGPHGAGKSTLLAAMARLAEHLGVAIARSEEETGLLLVEGFERLPRAEQRRRVARWQAAGRGFAVTTHRTLWVGWRRLPVVSRLAPDERLLAQLFTRLTAGRHTPVTQADAIERFHLHRGDLRRVWFDLYNLHETRLRNRTAEVRLAYTPV